MDKLHVWFYIIGAVFVAVLASSISAVWASKEDKFTSFFKKWKLFTARKSA